MLGKLESQPPEQSWESPFKHLVSKGINIPITLFFILYLSAVSPLIGAVSNQPLISVSEEVSDSSLLVVQKNSLRPMSEPTISTEKLNQKMKVIITGYSSTTWQTDDTPFITAAGTDVRRGIVAANFLPFGTRIRIPDVYGNRIFVVEDRMHPRNHYHVDIWFENYWEAKSFGVKNAYVEILEG